jgi:hypothetical protein
MTWKGLDMFTRGRLWLTLGRAAKVLGISYRELYDSVVSGESGLRVRRRTARDGRIYHMVDSGQVKRISRGEKA